jgi:hypothetical protein
MRRILAIIQQIIGFIVLALLLAPFIGPPLYLEIAGTSTPGTITVKQEVIFVRSEIWMRHLLVDVSYQPAGSGMEAGSVDIAVDAETYDSLRVGQPVRIRYISHPMLSTIRGLTTSRLETQWPFESFLHRMGPFIIGTIIGVLIWLALLYVVTKWRHWWLGLLFFTYMFGAVVIMGSGWPGPAPAGPYADGAATVRAFHLIDRVWGGRNTPAEDAVQPYTIVELRFVPAGKVDPVIAIDRIDAGSVAGIEMGAEIPIRYNIDNPRWAEIDGAARTYYWKNLRSFGMIALIVLFAIVLPWGLRQRRARRSQAAP